MSIAFRYALLSTLPLSVLACGGGGGGGGGPVGPSGPFDVAGSYASTFSSSRVVGCGGLVPEGSTTGTLTVTQNGNLVTLRLTQLSNNILTDPTGTVTDAGVFTYQGPVQVGNQQGTIDANGTITGTFTEAGRIDLVFSFSVLTCTVEGTISGMRG